MAILILGLLPIVVVYLVYGDTYGSNKKPSTPTTIKDPNDLTLTESSTEWTSTTKVKNECPKCKKEVSHNEFMASICNTCGDVRMERSLEIVSSRKIWNGKSWDFQYRTR
jgi:hypothetical protein